MIELSGVSFDHLRTPIFRDLNLKIGRGEKWAIIGPSGCGKTTLLSLVCGLNRPKAGQVMVDGTPLVKPRRSTGLILQDYGLLPWATIEQNILLGLQVQEFYNGHPFAKLDPRSVPAYREWVEKLGLTNLQTKYPNQLSGGQKQRAAIARALVSNPNILLLDEPFSALDSATRESLLEEIRAYTDANQTTMLFVTHSLNEAIDLCDHAMIFQDAPNNKFELLMPQPGQAREERITQVREWLAIDFEGNTPPVIEANS